MFGLNSTKINHERSPYQKFLLELAGDRKNNMQPIYEKMSTNLEKSLDDSENYSERQNRDINMIIQDSGPRPGKTHMNSGDFFIKLNSDE